MITTRKSSRPIRRAVLAQSRTGNPLLIVCRNHTLKGRFSTKRARWFERPNIIPNHVVELPDPNVTIAKNCKPFPIEFVVRGYVTGSSSTSLWTIYNRGDREYCGIQFPDGLVKNQALDTPVLTPTTKEEDHDRPISAKDIIAEGWMTQEHWDVASKKALELFSFGQKVSADHGLILVDTKYEMGLSSTGEITLIDEKAISPDSSRYWIKDSFEKRMGRGWNPRT